MPLSGPHWPQQRDHTTDCYQRLSVEITQDESATANYSALAQRIMAAVLRGGCADELLLTPEDLHPASPHGCCAPSCCFIRGLKQSSTSPITAVPLEAGSIIYSRRAGQ